MTGPIMVPFNNRACATAGCHRPAAVQPVIELRPAVDPTKHADVILGIGLCRKCCRRYAHEFLTDDLWKRLSAILAQQGKAPADRGLTTFSSVPIRFAPPS